MKQYELIKAYKATETLSHNNKLSAETLWGIYNLRKTLYPHYEFQSEREKDLKAKYAEYADKNGNITGQHLEEYMKELTELVNMDKNIEFNKITLPLKDNLGLTVEMMENLENFVEFTK